MKEFKYTTSFSSLVRPLVTEEKDKYLAMASLVDIGDFIPDVDAETNVDLLPVAFNAFVANRVNKNGDVIDTKTAIEITQNFINKPINIEHNRERVIGTILTAGFSEFGTDKVLTEEQVKELDGPFNVTLGGVLWRVVNNSLAELIEDSADPDNEFYQKISASWELGFSDYVLAVIDGESKNLEDAEIISDDEKIQELEGNLRGLGGNGTLEDGRNVYRQVVADVIPLGIGLTETPAADVKGVHTKKEKDKIIESKQENISQSENNDVKENTSIAMKITKIEDITNESIKMLEASAVSDFIQEQLKQASEDYSVEKKRLDNALTEATEKHEALEKEHTEAKEQLEKVQATLGELQAEKAQREAEERFSTRMAVLDEEFVLEDDERELIASDVKAMTDEEFASHIEKLNVLMKSKRREVVEAAIEQEKAKEEAKASEEAEEQKETEASAEEVIEEAIENAEVEETEVTNSIEASEPTIYEKYKSAFSEDQFDIK